LSSATGTSQIDCDHLEFGEGVVIHPTARICGPDGGRACSVRIGDQTYIGEGVQIRCADFAIGDYGRVHQYTTIHGYKPCTIGHNAWIGQHTVIDSIGGVAIGDNCGIGAHSQLWSHIKFGDTLAGCRFNSSRPLVVGRDVWFVGHCIVSPIVAADRSMAMVGSVVTKDMDENTIYAGVPAEPISSKIGPQFIEVPIEARVERMMAYAREAGVADQIVIVADRGNLDMRVASGMPVFFVGSRTYLKRRTPAEIAFMKYLLPERAKFVPAGD
jgi:acetyltransferase-like isoleucine patch superfamily enzyme